MERTPGRLPRPRPGSRPPHNRLRIDGQVQRAHRETRGDRARIATSTRDEDARIAPAPKSAGFPASSVRRSATVLAPSAARMAAPLRAAPSGRGSGSPRSSRDEKTSADAASRINSTVPRVRRSESRSPTASIRSPRPSGTPLGAPRGLPRERRAAGARGPRGLTWSKTAESSVIRCTGRPPSSPRGGGDRHDVAMISVSADTELTVRGPR